MRNVLDFLNTDYTWVSEGKRIEGKVLTRLAELIAVNGGKMKVECWGRVVEGQGVYGRTGLTMAEAVELIRLGGIVDGCLFAHEMNKAQYAGMSMKIQNEISRVNKEGKDAGIEIATEEKLREVLAQSKIEKVIEKDLRGGRSV